MIERKKTRQKQREKREEREEVSHIIQYPKVIGFLVSLLRIATLFRLFELQRRIFFSFIR
jgi:hypothetical protein